MINFPRGSEWRKWDLHVHTPKTKLNDQYSTNNGEDIWKLFCEKIENSDVSVFGITDYFSVNSYFQFIDKFKSIYSNSKKVFFPNIEFRIDSKNNRDEHIQLHVIFSNNRETLDKINNFLTRLKLVSTDDKNLTSKYCTEGDLNEIGYHKAMVKIDDLEESLKNDFTEDEYLIVGVANGYGSLRPSGKNDGRGSEYAKELDKKCKLFFGNSKNIDFFLNKKNGRDKYNLPPKPVIYGCDAHSFEVLDKKLGKSFEEKNEQNKIIDYSEITWIKADPTFEGLKQIIYEPEDRVKIQKHNPNSDFSKQIFSAIKIKETIVFNNGNIGFKETNIPINSNLITIIGGRGSGKSLLLDCISKVFNKRNKRAEDISIKNSDFIVEFTKFDETKEDYKIQDDNVLDYLHIDQGYVKEIVTPKESDRLDSEIKSLLNIRDIAFSKNESEIINLIDDIFEIKDFLLKQDEYGNKINSKEFINRQLKEKKKLIDNITTNRNRELIKEYTYNLKSINSYEQKKEHLYKLKEDLNNFQTKRNNIINKINNTIQNEGDKIPLISFNEQVKKMDSLTEKIEMEKIKLNDTNKGIEETFIQQGIKGDITTLLEQAKNYQDEIDRLNQKLKKIEEKEDILNKKFKSIEELILSIEQDYSKYKNEVYTKWLELKNGKKNWTDAQKKLVHKLLRDIEIEAEEIFDIDKFYEQLISFGILNMVKFKSTKDKNPLERIKEFFNIKNIDDYKKFLKNELKSQDEILFKELLDSNYFNKDGAKEFLKLLILNFNQYWKVLTKPKYKNKELYQLSAGMKGTMFLCIKLATDPFIKPFIFDQPEDDLDNDFIVNELVPIFREIKKYRQVIIVTHNANLVINADAEQVIIAKNKNEELSYTSGSIENPSIREKICNILEGGKEAFKKRKNRYNFKF